MIEESIRFSWKSFQAHLTSAFRNLQSEESFADVTLVSDDQVQMPAHKIVLSACSPVLKNLLLMNPHPHPLLYLRGIKQQELQSVLQFMYIGETTMDQDLVDGFINIAKDLQLKELHVENGEIVDGKDISEAEVDPIDNNQSCTNDELVNRKDISNDVQTKEFITVHKTDQEIFTIKSETDIVDADGSMLENQSTDNEHLDLKLAECSANTVQEV